MNPVCVKCEIEMRVKHNGVLAESMACNGESLAGFSADLWACPECGAEILILAREPLIEHFNTGFSGWMEREGATRPRHVRFWMNEREKELAATKGAAR